MKTENSLATPSVVLPDDSISAPVEGEDDTMMGDEQCDQESVPSIRRSPRLLSKSAYS